MHHQPPKAIEPLLHDLPSGKLVRKAQFLREVPIVAMADEAIEHARCEGIARANCTGYQVLEWESSREAG